MRLKDGIRAKTRRTRGTSLARIIADLNPTLKGWGGVLALCRPMKCHSSSGATPVSTCPKSGWALLVIALDGMLVGGLTGLVGAGGGFLIVPALTLLGGLSMHAAIGTSLLIVACNSCAGLAGYLSHVQIDPVFAGSVTALALAGNLAGVRLARHVSASGLRRVFALFVIGVALYLLWREDAATTIANSLANHAEFWLGGLAVAAVVLVYNLFGKLHLWMRSRWLIRNSPLSHSLTASEETHHG